MMNKKQRYISTSFWDDKWIRTLDPSERYLYLYLLTNPLTNIAGVYEITLDRIAFDTGYDSRTLLPMFDRFAKSGKAYLIDGEWIIIPSWPKHQKLSKRDNNRIGVDKILESIPIEIFDKLSEVGYQYRFIADVVRDYQAPSKPLPRESNYSDSDLDFDLDSDSNSDTSKYEKPFIPASEAHGNNPTEIPEHVRLAVLWFNELSKQSANPIGPNQRQKEQAREALEVLGGDAELFTACVRYYWENCTQLWWYKENRKHNFGSFTANIAEIVPAAGKHIKEDRVREGSAEYLKITPSDTDETPF